MNNETLDAAVRIREETEALRTELHIWKGAVESTIRNYVIKQIKQQIQESESELSSL